MAKCEAFPIRPDADTMPVLLVTPAEAPQSFLRLLNTRYARTKSVRQGFRRNPPLDDR